MLQDDGSTIAICTGDGENIYEPDKSLPASGVTMDWYVGKKCFLGAGRYRIVTNWNIERQNGDGVIGTRLVSNVFSVRS